MLPWMTLLAQQEPQNNLFFLFLVQWGPLFIIAMLIYLFFYKKAGTPQIDVVKRYHDHLDKREASYDEIIAQLRELNQTLKDSDKQR